MPIDLKKCNLLEGLEDDVDFIFEGLKIAILEDIVMIMKNKRISRAELARRLNTSRAYITRMLRANVNFTLMSLIRIAKALGAELTVNFCLPESKIEWFQKTKISTEPIEQPITYSSAVHEEPIYYGGRRETRTDTA